MKNYYFFVLFLLISIPFNAQNIENFGLEFKNILVNQNCVAPSFGATGISKVDTNNDGEISIAEAEAVTHLQLSGNNVIDATGIEYFTNLETLSCENSSLSSLNVSAFINLERLNCANNQITELIGLNNLNELIALICNNNELSTLDVSNSSNLNYLECGYNQLTNLTLGTSTSYLILDCNNNQLTEIDVSGYPNLEEFYISNNLLTSLDLSNNTNFYFIGADNNEITTVFIKNGIQDLYWDEHYSYFNLTGNPIHYICADESEFIGIQYMMEWAEIENYTANSYCSFYPGGDYFIIDGNITMDLDANG